MVSLVSEMRGITWGSIKTKKFRLQQASTQDAQKDSLILLNGSSQVTTKAQRRLKNTRLSRGTFFVADVSFDAASGLPSPDSSPEDRRRARASG